MKISSIIFISILLLFCACSGNTSSEISYEQILSRAKILVYNSDSTVAELQKAQLMVSEIPADAPEYLDGRELIKFINERESLNLQPTPTPPDSPEQTPTDSQATTANENQNRSENQNVSIRQLQNDSADNSRTASSSKSQTNNSQVKDDFDSKPIIFSETFSIKSDDMKALGFTFFSARDLTVEFDASGKDIECHIVSEADFEKLRDKTDFKSFYSSGRVKRGKINLPMKSPFYLVFDNSYSSVTAKTVKASVKALKK